MQIRSIEETKVSKKSKCGILPFVQNFEEFAIQAENIFKGSDRRADLDRWYVKVMHAMFETIAKIAVDHQKTPQEVVVMGKIGWENERPFNKKNVTLNKQ